MWKAKTVQKLLILSFTATILTGCSSFNRGWKRAAAAEAVPQDGILGRWEGSWRSEVNGHNGRLRCLVTRVNDTTYDARYHAKYKKIFSFGYSVPLQVEKANTAYRFKGEADLGKLAGGVYQYDGTANSTNFTSTYLSKYDHGYFQMQRPSASGK
jgi:hypothetical protein